MILKNNIAFILLFFLAPALLAQEKVSFKKDVLPLLKNNCIRCHGAKKARAGLRLDNPESIEKGVTDGEYKYKVLDRKSPKKSILLLQIQETEDDNRCPPNNPLNDKNIEIIKKWVLDGAKFKD